VAADEQFAIADASWLVHTMFLQFTTVSRYFCEVRGVYVSVWVDHH